MMKPLAIFGLVKFFLLERDDKGTGEDVLLCKSDTSNTLDWSNVNTVINHVTYFNQ